MELILHRGDISISQENTIEAILDNNYNLIEIDLYCNNNDIYVIHDTNLNRLCNKNKDISVDIDLTDTKIQKEIKYNNKILKYENEKSICMFEDLLKKIKKTKKKLCLDLKNYDFEYFKICKTQDKLIELLHNYSTNIMYFSCFNMKVFEFVFDLCKVIEYGVFMSDKIDDYDLNYYIDKTDSKYLIYKKKDKIDLKYKNKKIVLYTCSKEEIKDNIKCDYVIFDNI